MAQPPSPNNQAYKGAQDLLSGNGEANAQNFVIRQVLARVWTATVVEVMAVTNTGTLDPVGFVDIRPLVNMTDGRGDARGHGTIYRAPYFRLQGGANAIVLDPQVGDLGIAVFAHSDVSSVKVNKKASNPGSRRKFDPADALYLGGLLNGAPSQVVQFSAAGITIISSADVTITANSGKVTVNATEVDLVSDNVNLGATGGKKVVLDGDPVVAGAVVASSTKVKGV